MHFGSFNRPEIMNVQMRYKRETPGLTISAILLSVSSHAKLVPGSEKVQIGILPMTDLARGSESAPISRPQCQKILE